MRVNTSKLAGMQRRFDSLHAVYHDLSRQLDEVRQILARLKNPYIDIHLGTLKKDTPQNIIGQIESAEVEHDRLLKLRDDAADQQQRYGESIQGCLDWAEGKLRQSGMGQPRINLGDGR